MFTKDGNGISTIITKEEKLHYEYADLLAQKKSLEDELVKVNELIAECVRLKVALPIKPIIGE